MMTKDEINASQKAQLSQWFDLASRSLDEAEKLFELNFSTCRDTLQEMAHSCQCACDVRDMPGAFNWQTGAIKPLAEQSAQYGARLMGLASGTGREFSRLFEHQWQDAVRQMNGWIGSVPMEGDSGPQATFDYLRKAMGAFDSVWASTRENLEQSQKAVLRSIQAPKPSTRTPTAARRAG